MFNTNVAWLVVSLQAVYIVYLQWFRKKTRIIPGVHKAEPRAMKTRKEV